MDHVSEGDRPTQNYLVRGVGPKGKSCVEIVQAIGAQHAMDLFAGRGYSNIQIETDDAVRSFPGGGGVDQKFLSPRDMLRIQRFSPLGNQFYRYWVAYRLLGAPFVIFAVLFVFRRVLGMPLNWFDGVLVLLILVPGILAHGISTGAPRLYRQLQKEYVRARYDRVFKIVSKFERAAKDRPSSVLTVVSVEWRARALAKQGRFTEAFALVETLHAVPGLSPAMYCHVKALVHLIADDYEDAVECYRRLTEIEPENPLGWSGMIDPLAIYLKRTAEARVFLERLRSLPLSPFSQKGLRYQEGMILLTEGKYAESRICIEEFLPVVQKLKRKSPISVLFESVVRAQLAIACAKSGDVAEARTQIKTAGPYMKLHKMDKLLDRCRREGVSV